MTNPNDMNTEIIIPLPNGGTLRCGPGEEFIFGGYLRICDQNDNELLYWDSTEWEEQPELAVGAVFSAAVKPLADLMRNRILVDGVWLFSGGNALYDKDSDAPRPV